MPRGLTDDTPRCAARKKKWRNYVPKDAELPKLPGGGLSPNQMKSALAAQELPPSWYKGYCLQRAGAGTSHLGTGHCNKCHGGNQGEGELSPAWQGGKSAHRLKARSRISDEGRREFFDKLVEDPELLSHQTDLVKLRLIADDIEEQAHMEEIPWAVHRSRKAADEIEKQVERLRKFIESGSVSHAEDVLEEIEAQCSLIHEAVSQRDLAEWERRETTKIIDKITRVAAAERQRRIDLMAMLPMEKVQSIVTQIGLSMEIATGDCITQHNMETLTPEELQDLVTQTLAKHMGTLETMERQKLLGGVPEYAEAI